MNNSTRANLPPDHSRDRCAPTPANEPDMHASGEPLPELRIEILRDIWVDYIGTGAQLKAAGLIPHGLEWPEADGNQRWESNGFDYWLTRIRPEGFTGSRPSWIEMDNWSLRVTVTGRGRNWHASRRSEREAESMSSHQYRFAAAGTRELSAHCVRYRKAVRDKRFQAFKALIPGLSRPNKARGVG